MFSNEIGFEVGETPCRSPHENQAEGDLDQESYRQSSK